MVLVCLTGQQTHQTYCQEENEKQETQKNADELKATVKETWASITFTYLADKTYLVIQSNLHCIQVTVSTFYQLLLSLGIEPMILALLAPCSTS